MKMMTAALAGAAVGAVATLAMSPETREKLKERLSTAKDDVSDLVEKGKKAVSNVAQTAKDEYSGLLEESKKTVSHHSNNSGLGSKKSQDDLKTAI